MTDIKKLAFLIREARSSIEYGAFYIWDDEQLDELSNAADWLDMVAGDRSDIDLRRLRLPDDATTPPQ